jgi:cytochrome b
MIEKRYIYDKFTRILHWSIALSILTLFLSAKVAAIFYEESVIRHYAWQIHIFSGYAFSLLLIMRIGGLFFGGKYAKIQSFINLEKWKLILKNKKMIWGWGHHPVAAILYLGVYGLMGFLVYSGLFLARIQFDLGPISEKYFDDMILLKNYLERHELASNLILLFVFGHLLALLWHQVRDGVPIISSMLDGYQHKIIKEVKDENMHELVKHNDSIQSK